MDDPRLRPPFWEPCGRKGHKSIFGVCCRYSLNTYIQWFRRHDYKLHHTIKIAYNFDALPLPFIEGYILGMSRVHARCADDLYKETQITGIPSAGFLAAIMDQTLTTMTRDGKVSDTAINDLAARICEFGFYYLERFEKETGKRKATARRCIVRSSEIDEICEAIERAMK